MVLPTAACATNAIVAPKSPSSGRHPVYARTAGMTLIPWYPAIPHLGYATLRPHERSHEYFSRGADAARGARRPGPEHDRGGRLPGAAAVPDRRLQSFRPVPADRPSWPRAVAARCSVG